MSTPRPRPTPLQVAGTALNRGLPGLMLGRRPGLAPVPREENRGYRPSICIPQIVGHTNVYSQNKGRQLYAYQYGQTAVNSYTPSSAAHVFLDESPEMVAPGIWSQDINAATSRWLPQSDPTFTSETLTTLIYTDNSAVNLASFSKPAGEDWLGWGFYAFIRWSALAQVTEPYRIRVKLLRVPSSYYQLVVRFGTNTVQWNTSNGQAPPPSTLRTFQVMGEWTSGLSPAPATNPADTLAGPGGRLKLLDLSDPIGCFALVMEDHYLGQEPPWVYNNNTNDEQWSAEMNCTAVALYGSC